ncbi:hypothetical protein, partial [Roseimaritima sediminicola]|uniref:hypothetical protein n=1 Tax=Roseimaritima sediminicola TaxID=2662066 RepID=UPI00192A64BC
HLPAGLSIWQYGDFGLYRVNPPLVRAVATLPLAQMDVETDYIYAADTRDRPEFPMGTRFWQRHGLQAYAYLTLARITAIPFILIAGGTIFCWSRSLYGQRAGLFSLTLWCFSPLVLANASMITQALPATREGGQ